MSDKSFTPENGITYEVLRIARNRFSVKSQNRKNEFYLETECTNIDHQTKRIHLHGPNGRKVFWIFSIRSKRFLAWPGGSMELDSQDLCESSSAASGNIKPLKLTMPGKILSIKVKEGDLVENGQALLVVEAMKMENLILATSKARIAKIHISTGDRLESGAVLISFSPAEN